MVGFKFLKPAITDFHLGTAGKKKKDIDISSFKLIFGELVSKQLLIYKSSMSGATLIIHLESCVKSNTSPMFTLV